MESEVTTVETPKKAIGAISEGMGDMREMWEVDERREAIVTDALMFAFYVVFCGFTDYRRAVLDAAAQTITGPRLQTSIARIAIGLSVNMLRRSPPARM
jgi:hypothetical protein